MGFKTFGRNSNSDVFGGFEFDILVNFISFAVNGKNCSRGGDGSAKGGRVREIYYIRYNSKNNNTGKNDDSDNNIFEWSFFGSHISLSFYK